MEVGEHGGTGIWCDSDSDPFAVVRTPVWTCGRAILKALEISVEVVDWGMN